MTRQILTANRLSDGAVVYLDRDGGWSTHFGGAWVVDNDIDARSFEDFGQRAEHALIVVGAYLMDVVCHGDGFQPVRMREIIRAEGPTVLPKHAA